MARVNYFKGAETLEDVREKLIQHLQEIDPKSGKFETMVRQYLASCEENGKKHKNKYGKLYEGKSEVKISPEDFRSLMTKILAMKGVKIAIEGRWIWASGDTKKYSKELSELNKSLGGTGTLMYSGKRQAWYFKDAA